MVFRTRRQPQSKLKKSIVNTHKILKQFTYLFILFNPKIDFLQKSFIKNQPIKTDNTHCKIISYQTDLR